MTSNDGATTRYQRVFNVLTFAMTSNVPFFFIRLYSVHFQITQFPSIFDDVEKSAYGNGHHFELAVEKGVSLVGFVFFLCVNFFQGEPFQPWESSVTNS